MPIIQNKTIICDRCGQEIAFEHVVMKEQDELTHLPIKRYYHKGCAQAKLNEPT